MPPVPISQYYSICILQFHSGIFYATSFSSPTQYYSQVSYLYVYCSSCRELYNEAVLKLQVCLLLLMTWLSRLVFFASLVNLSYFSEKRRWKDMRSECFAYRVRWKIILRHSKSSHVQPVWRFERPSLLYLIEVAAIYQESKKPSWLILCRSTIINKRS